jgi:PRTRC genetic system ThiF family protein
MQSNKIHIAHTYLGEATNRITVNLAGLGGTGSHMLSCLIQIDQILKMLRKPNLVVKAFDPDEVERHNIGRQLFTKGELGMNKAVAAITRTNRYYGTNWRAFPVKFPDGLDENIWPGANIIITCVDNIASRFGIRKVFPNKKDNVEGRHITVTPMYWLDIGNDRYTGQVILGSFSPSRSRARNHVRMLPTFAEMFPEMEGKKDNDAPSCSAIESLQKQDLFINKLLATLAGDLLWQLMFSGVITCQGYFVNLKTGKVNPILIK